MDATAFGPLLRSGAEALQGLSSSPQLDAELLLAAVTGQSRSTFRAAPERPATQEQYRKYQSLIERRQQGEPVAYLTGFQDFWTLTLEVGPQVLVPRPETELVVERALTHLADHDPARVLDLATGSGAIALAIASERPQARVIATDLSPDALNLAQRNARRLKLDRVRFLVGSWYAPVAGERFDVITSNPPYIAADDPDLEPGVRAYEPEMALIAGSTGLECVEQIVSGAPLHLQPGGWLVLEHGWQQAGTIRNLLEVTGFTHVTSHADLAGHERVTEGRWPGP